MSGDGCAGGCCAGGCCGGGCCTGGGCCAGGGVSGGGLKGEDDDPPPPQLTSVSAVAANSESTANRSALAERTSGEADAKTPGDVSGLRENSIEGQDDAGRPTQCRAIMPTASRVTCSSDTPPPPPPPPRRSKSSEPWTQDFTHSCFLPVLFPVDGSVPSRRESIPCVWYAASMTAYSPLHLLLKL